MWDDAAVLVPHDRERKRITQLNQAVHRKAFSVSLSGHSSRRDTVAELKHRSN
jgi:hypothetical protein